MVTAERNDDSKQLGVKIWTDVYHKLGNEVHKAMIFSLGRVVYTSLYFEDKWDRSFKTRKNCIDAGRIKQVC